MEVVAQLRASRVAAVLEASRGNVASVLNVAPDSYEAQVYVRDLTDPQRSALIGVVENPR